MSETAKALKVITAQDIRRIGGTAAERLALLSGADLTAMDRQELRHLTTAILAGADTPLAGDLPEQLTYESIVQPSNAPRFGLVAKGGPNPFASEITDFEAALDNGSRHLADAYRAYEGGAEDDMPEYLGSFATTDRP